MALSDDVVVMAKKMKTVSSSPDAMAKGKEGRTTTEGAGFQHGWGRSQRISWGTAMSWMGVIGHKWWLHGGNGLCCWKFFDILLLFLFYEFCPLFFGGILFVEDCDFDFSLNHVLCSLGWAWFGWFRVYFGMLLPFSWIWLNCGFSLNTATNVHGSGVPFY